MSAVRFRLQPPFLFSWEGRPFEHAHARAHANGRLGPAPPLSQARTSKPNRLLETRSCSTALRQSTESEPTAFTATGRARSRTETPVPRSCNSGPALSMHAPLWGKGAKWIGSAVAPALVVKARKVRPRTCSGLSQEVLCVPPPRLYGITIRVFALPVFHPAPGTSPSAPRPLQAMKSVPPGNLSGSVPQQSDGCGNNPEAWHREGLAKIDHGTSGLGS